MPPSVQAVDDWLRAHANGDSAGMAERTWSGDRDLVKAALAEREKDPNGALALLLPPKPISHEIVEIQTKETDDRHVVLAKVTMKNPLPFASERTGNALPDIPKTRTEERKILAVREGDRWGVKLDLEAVKLRASFAEDFFSALGRKEWDAARAMLRSVPPPPDDPNALQRKDRMVLELQEELDKRVRTSSVQ
jgi:hypothetical protein